MVVGFELCHSCVSNEYGEQPHKKKENRAHRFKWRISPSNVSSGDRGPSTSQARTGNVPKLAKQIPPKDSVKLLNAE